MAGFLAQFPLADMLSERVAITLLLIPFVIWFIADGGWLFSGAIACVLALAAWEYGQLFRKHGFRPAIPLLVAGSLYFALSRHSQAFDFAPSALTALCLTSMVWHIWDFERGAQRAGTDFALTLGGTLYIGWIGSYLISLRGLSDGKWWLLVALPSIWMADSGAYFIGKRFGRHQLAPRLSPNKTWEGYLAGIPIGGLIGSGLALLWQFGAGPGSALNWTRGLMVGLAVSVLAPLGDLGISMIKREIKVKDSGVIIPGHGGVLDRLDSWLWASVIGFYVISWIAG